MATYRNKNDDTIFYGGEFKLKISMDTIGGHNMEDINFNCTFSTGGTPVVLQKNQMVPVEDDPTTYIAPLKSTNLGRGTLTVKYEAYIPDTDFDTDKSPELRFRKEIVEIPTKIKIK